MKVALLQPDAARAVGHRGLLGAPAAGAAGAVRRRRAAKRGKKGPPRGTDLCVYHVGNNPDAHGWIVDALRRTPGVVVLHDFVLHHLVAGLTIGRRDGHGYLDAMEREGGVVGRLLGHAVLDKRIPPLWENRPAGLPPRRRGARPRDRARSSTPATSATERAHAGYAGPIWIVPHPAFPVPDAGGGRRPGRAALRLLRQRQREQARAAAARGVRPRCGGDTPGAGCSSSAPPRPASTSTAGCSGSGSTAPASCARATSTRRRLWALMIACRRARQPPLAHDGRDVGHGDPRALARPAARSSATSAGSPSCRTTSR